MRKRIQVGWIVIILMTMSLTISACVRPYPGSEVQAEVPPVGLISTQPPTFLTLVPTIPPSPSSETPEPNVTEPTSIPIEPTSEPSTETKYIVVAGDTLFKIALDFDVTVEDIAEANGIINVDSLEIGQELIIPGESTEGSSEQANAGQDSGENEGSTNEGDGTGEAPVSDGTTVPETEQPTPVSGAGSVHIVQPGENLFRIGLQYGCSVEQLARYNGIATPNRISVGLEIQIPDCN
jgi:LysM repeat protein